MSSTAGFASAVLEVADAAEANAIVVEIARSPGADEVVDFLERGVSDTGAPDPALSTSWPAPAAL